MVGPNGYFVNPETACRAARSGRNSSEDRRHLSVGLAMGKRQGRDSGRLREVDPPSRRGR